VASKRRSRRSRPALEGIDVDSTIFRPATFVEQSLRNLTRAMGLGCVLVLVVLSRSSPTGGRP
jgi:hypothetical protein